jgi:hypothetical protein
MVAVAAPAEAKHHGSTGATGSTVATGSTGSKNKKCKPHATAFVVSGTLVSGSLTTNPIARVPQPHARSAAEVTAAGVR